MTTDHVATRTLVKSPPELWAECSDPEALARHLSQSFGEIRITRLDPEKSVAWEGELANGTVQIEPSGWGTRVTLTAEPKVEDDPVEEEVDAKVEEEEEAAQPDHDVVADPGRPRRRWRRLMERTRAWFMPTADEVGPPPEEVIGESEAVAEVPEPEPTPEPAPAPDAVDATAILSAALDSLGQAHHRPFSRA